MIFNPQREYGCFISLFIPTELRPLRTVDQDSIPNGLLLAGAVFLLAPVLDSLLRYASCFKLLLCDPLLNLMHRSLPTSHSFSRLIALFHAPKEGVGLLLDV